MTRFDRRWIQSQGADAAPASFVRCVAERADGLPRGGSLLACPIDSFLGQNFRAGGVAAPSAGLYCSVLYTKTLWTTPGTLRKNPMRKKGVWKKGVYLKRGFPMYLLVTRENIYLFLRFASCWEILKFRAESTRSEAKILETLQFRGQALGLRRKSWES